MHLQNTTSTSDADEIFMTFAPGTQNDTNISPRGSPTSQYEDPLDDVFGSAPSSPVLEQSSLTDRHNASSDPSDIPRLRRIHVTNGYRDGIAASKEQHVQTGFDEGYALGAELGMRVGWILGALEGLIHAVPAGASEDDTVTKEQVNEVFARAETDLRAENLYGEQYFGGDGVWVYSVPGTEEDAKEDVTFKEVADAHPLVADWMAKARDLAKRAGIALR